MAGDMCETVNHNLYVGWGCSESVSVSNTQKFSVKSNTVIKA